MGSTGWLTGGAPAPEPERVAMIRYTIVDEPETCAGFAESLRATLVALDEAVRDHTAAGDAAECAALLSQARDRVVVLQPARLEPRPGLAGLFDSRGKRLKAFRAAYASAAADTSGTASALGDRSTALARRDEALDALWTRTRDAIIDLDAHIVAGRAWLADWTATPSAASPPQAREEMSPSEPAPFKVALDAASTPDLDPPAGPSDDESAEVVTVSGEDPATEPVVIADEAAGPSALRHPLEARLSELTALRARAVGNLALLRAAQNADCRTPATLGSVGDCLEAWRTDWQTALGLAGKKPKKVRPDPARLDEARTVLTDRLAAAERDIAATQDRRAELQLRSA